VDCCLFLVNSSATKPRSPIFENSFIILSGEVPVDVANAFITILSETPIFLSSHAGKTLPVNKLRTAEKIAF